MECGSFSMNIRKMACHTTQPPLFRNEHIIIKIMYNLEWK